MFARFTTRSQPLRLAIHGRAASTAAGILAKPTSISPLTSVLAAASVTAVVAAASVQNQAECTAKVPYTGAPGTVNERSFIAIKPDGVQRALVGEVITRFEKKGYKLVAMKMIWPTEKMAAKHYEDLSKKAFFGGLVKYFSSGPIVAMVWEGPDVILTGRKMLGATNPNSSDPGSLRGEYCICVGRNLIHGSDGPDSAKHEIGMWFTEKECSAWPRTMDKWITDDN